MAEPGDRSEEMSLWRRWRPLARPAGDLDDAAAALALAGYAEGRLDEAEAEAIEDWLVEHPEALTDLVAARLADEAAAPKATEAMVARAAGLNPQSGGNVVRFPGARGGWRAAMAWSGLAASVLATSLFGFALGDNAYSHLASRDTSSETAIHELLDPPTGLFSVEDEDSAT